MVLVQEMDDLWAVLAYGELTFRVPRALVAAGVEPGDVVRLRVERDEEASRARRLQAQRLMGDPGAP